MACTAIDADWSNLPMRSFYLPLLQRLSVYLASTRLSAAQSRDRPRDLRFPAGRRRREEGERSRLPNGGVVELPIVKKGNARGGRIQPHAAAGPVHSCNRRARRRSITW